MEIVSFHNLFGSLKSEVTTASVITFKYLKFCIIFFLFFERLNSVQLLDELTNKNVNF